MSIWLVVVIIVVALVLVFARSRWRLTRRRWWQRR